MLDEKPEISDKPDAQPAKPFARKIELQNVSFAYAETPVLKNINLTVEAGQMVALVGMSGVGKSTLVDLIPRFYDVKSGRILVDGVDVRDLTVQSLRAQIGIVTQHTFLFNDTIRNNIAYGDPERDMDAIIAAAKAAHAHEFIDAMPNGYDSEIGEMGLQLSGGQRQRVGDRAGVAERCADPDPRRSDFLVGCRLRTFGSRRVGNSDEHPDDDRYRPSAVDDSQG